MYVYVTVIASVRQTVGISVVEMVNGLIDWLTLYVPLDTK